MRIGLPLVDYIGQLVRNHPQWKNDYVYDVQDKAYFYIPYYEIQYLKHCLAGFILASP